ncbi:MAG: division/cell wall cluster transcriptional repressor MraZ [Flavobacteriaceae bacterium]|nr:MAG: division/cell wall cluster transcriptional repressor MraZ [Flavobacteriaceae bacterium]
MENLVGFFECKVDAKGRLSLPSDLKKQLGDQYDKPFILKRSLFQPCLEIHPMESWEKISEKLSKLNRFVQKNNEFIRRFTAGVKKTEIDASNRLQIGKELIAFAGIQKDVVLNASIDFIEVWEKEAYEKAVNNNEIDFAALAEEVMGNSWDQNVS